MDAAAATRVDACAAESQRHRLRHASWRLRLAFEEGTVPLEVSLPVLATRVKEPNNFPRVRINAGKICSLKDVAWDTGPGAVFMGIRTVMELGNDVIELERQVIIILWNLAVFAAIVRAAADQVCGGSVHGNQEVVFFNLRRILALRIDSRWPTWM